MTEYPAPLARLIQELCKLPSIGEKTAGRLAFFMLKADKRDISALSESIGKLKEEIGLCPTCFGLSEVVPGTGEATQCKVCRDPRRDRHDVCVVEEPVDLMAMERSHEFKGVYHVLHGAISPLDGIGPDSLRIEDLLARIRSSDIGEVIVATNPTLAGEATALYLAKVSNPIDKVLSQLADQLGEGVTLDIDGTP